MAKILVTNAGDVLGKRIINELTRRGHTIITSPAQKHDTLIICNDLSVEETKNRVKTARKARLRHLVLISALGASPYSKNRHLVTKYEEELIIKQSAVPYTIFRPGIIISRIRFALRFPLPGFLANRGLQPTYSGDIARSIAGAVDAGPKNATSQLLAPEKLALRELLILTAKSLKRRFR